nr:PREDICTED: ABC transporter F family member 4-like [Megachile rotundata]
MVGELAGYVDGKTAKGNAVVGKVGKSGQAEMEMFAKIKRSKAPGREVADMMERIREQINGKLKDSERARKERGEEERKQSGAKGKGKQRARQEEQGKGNKGKAKERRIWEEEEEDELNRTLMEAAVAVEEAEASMGELEEVFRWEEESSQDLLRPTSSSTPTPGREAVTEAGRKDSKGRDREECVTESRKRGNTLMATEDERPEREAGKAKIRQIEGSETEAEGKGEEGTGTGAKQEEEQKLIRMIKEMRANFEKDKEAKGKRSEEKRDDDREIKEGKKQNEGGIGIEGGKGVRKEEKGGTEERWEGEGRWFARVHSDTVEIAIRITDPDLDKEELLRAYRESRLGELVRNGDIRFRCIKGPEGTCHRIAYLDCTREAAKEMVQEKEIRTKWQELRPFFRRRKSEAEDKSRKRDGKGNTGAKKEGKNEEKKTAEIEQWAKPGTSKDPCTRETAGKKGMISVIFNSGLAKPATGRRNTIDTVKVTGEAAVACQNLSEMKGQETGTTGRDPETKIWNKATCPIASGTSAPG